MNRRLIALLASLSASMASAQDAGGQPDAGAVPIEAAPIAAAPPKVDETKGDVIVQVDGLRSDKGFVEMTLFGSDDGFPNKVKKAVAIAYVPIKGGKATHTFASVPRKEYAVGTCHDENGNKECDTNFLGIPKEGVACSNTAHRKNMIPQYAKAKFAVDRAQVTVPVTDYAY